MLKDYKLGYRVRAADLFTAFGGLWGHEEFEARNHKLIKLKLGTISSDYLEGPPRHEPLPLEDLGLARPVNLKFRKKNEETMVAPVIDFDSDKRVRPDLRLLHRIMTANVKNLGRKVLKGGKLSWNIEHFTTIDHNFKLKFKWVIENLGTRKEPALVPILYKIGRKDAADFGFGEQKKVVGDMFQARCELTEETITKIKCNGI